MDLNPEDFGSGLEQPVTSPVAATSPATQDQPDSFIQELGTIFGDLPSGLTRESFADHVLGLQSRQAELEAQLASAIAAQAAPPAQPVLPNAPSVAPAEARKRKYEVVQVDPYIEQLCVLDSKGNGYLPSVPNSPIHMQAAQQMNVALQKRSAISRDFVSDPYGTVNELIQDEVDRLNAQWQKKLDDLAGAVKPISEQMTVNQAEAAHNRWVNEHAAELFDAQDQLTPLGSTVHKLLSNPKLTQDEALEIARQLVPQEAPANPAAPLRLAKAPAPAPVVEAKPNFADTYRNRVLRTGGAVPERTPYEGPTTKRPTHRDLAKQLGLSDN